MDKLLFTTAEAMNTLGCRTTKLYELIGAGRLDARACGGRTLITGESLRAFAASLPPAPIGQNAKEAA